MGNQRQIIETIERFDESFNHHDLDAVLELMTDDIVFENTSNIRLEGKLAVGKFLRRAFDLMASGWFNTEERFVYEDRCVVRWVYLLNREDSNSGNIRGVDLFRVSNNKVAEKLSYIKSEEFVNKLGLIVHK